MPTSIRTYRLLVNLSESLLALLLTVGAFLMLQHGTVPFPWAWAVLGMATILLSLGLMVYVGYDGGDTTPLHAIMFAAGFSIVLGLACNAAIEQRKDVELFLGRVSWLAVGVFPAYFGIRGLWESMDASDLDDLTYFLWRKEFARIACDPNASLTYRFASALRLRLPDDEDALRECLPAFEGYRSYDLSRGWPHTHSFEEVSSDATSDGDGNLVTTLREACHCGATRTRVTEQIVVGTKLGCPNCGGEVNPTQEDVWMGGHFTYIDLYVCSECGRSDDVDFSVEQPIYEERTVSVTYD